MSIEKIDLLLHEKRHCISLSTKNCLDWWSNFYFLGKETLSKNNSNNSIITYFLVSFSIAFASQFPRKI